MAIDVRQENDASVTTLVSGIITDAQALMKQQFESAQTRSGRGFAQDQGCEPVLRHRRSPLVFSARYCCL